MAIRYTPEELKHLRESPLSAIKPPGLPPAEQWMGPKPPADTTHQSNKRPQHISRGSANPEDIILGPPKMAFMSSTSIRTSGKPLDFLDRATRESGSRDRFNFGSLRRDTENDQSRDSRGGLSRPKHEGGESDNDGWSTVKPRKSFGAEGAERFNGRMGLDRRGDDRRFKDRDDRDPKERPQRGFDTFSRDKDGDHDQDRETRRNGVGRSRNESWFRTDGDALPTARDRNNTGDKLVDRTRGWREKDPNPRVTERNDRHDRGDRKWDRDQRHEREPEWMDEPAEERNQAHTQEDFQKWKEQMQGKDKSSSAAPRVEESGDAGGFFAAEKPKVDTTLTLDTGPDKFFGMWATPKDDGGLDSGIVREGSAKPQATGKASRFTSFFTPQEEPSRAQVEPHPPAPGPSEGLGALFQNATAAPDPREKAAFAELLQKLKGNSLGGPSPPPGLQQPQAKPHEMLQNPITSPEPPQQYRPGNQEEIRPTTRNSQGSIQSLLSQRQGAGSQPTTRPEQMLHELVGQRQNALSQSSSRPEQPHSRSNTEFLMNLMQGAKATPEPPRNEQLLMRMPPPGQKPGDRQMQQQMMEAEMQREAAAQRERSASQRQARPPPPPGFFEDPAAFQRGPPPPHERQPQPTQILQRPPPPGLEQAPPSWSQPGMPGPPPQQMRPHIAPPPGLGAGGPPEMRNRGMPPPPMGQQMFPPGFMPPGMSGFQGAEAMGPPRMQPPLGFYGPPPGFIPSGVNGGFQGPEGMPFGGPFDGRGPPPPQGAFRRQ